MGVSDRCAFEAFTFSTRSECGHLGLLDWDSTKIVFTKRSLIEFLKYVEHFGDGRVGLSCCKVHRSDRGHEHDEHPETTS